MAVPHRTENFGDLLDIRFQRIFNDQYNQLPDMVGELFTYETPNGRSTMQWSSVGTLPDLEQFTGTIGYQSQHQGYDVTAAVLEFAGGTQVERKLFDWDQYNIMDQRPRALATAAQRTRQKHAAEILNRAFTVNSDFFTHTEGVAMCSNSHTTTSGASTSSGFDNLGTAAMSAVSVQAARLQMRGYRGDQGERITIAPDELWYPPDLEETAFEIISSSGKVDTALNNKNINEGRYRGYDWEYLTDTNNWFMVDGTMRRQNLFWVDDLPIEFGMIEDFDTLVAKFRAYTRYTMAWIDWRFIYGAQVS